MNAETLTNASFWAGMSDKLASVGLKIIGAILIYMVGRWLINLVIRMVTTALSKQQFDPTLLRYLGSAINVTLNIILVVAILGYFGVQTTSFAALIAGLGVAIGAAWAGLLGNFAAGIFLVVLRPFKVGDYVKAGGVEGTVHEMGLFGTTINTPDNVMTLVGNGKIFGDTIQNFSSNPFRRVDRSAQLAHSVSVDDAIARLKVAVPQIANVIANPAPDIRVIDFNERGPVLCVRPYCHTDHYWQVYFDTNELIAKTFGEAGYAVPETVVRMRSA
jgi:small conductance mechanosensitive channel